MIVSPYYRNGVIVFSERYEQLDPISLPSKRTHGNGGVINQSDGKLELSTPISPFLPHPLTPSQFILFLVAFYLLSDFLSVSLVLFFIRRLFPFRAIRDYIHINNDCVFLLYN